MIKETNSKLRILMQVIQRNLVKIKIGYCVKSVRIRSFSNLYSVRMRENKE